MTDLKEKKKSCWDMKKKTAWRRVASRTDDYIMPRVYVYIYAVILVNFLM